MRKGLFSTTFSKMTVSYMLLGIVPLFVLGLLFFSRYSSVFKENMLHSCFSMTSYISKNVAYVLNSVDDTMSGIYDYRDEEGRTLGEILEDDAVSESLREQEVNAVLQEMMSSNEYISSFRLVDFKGRIFSLYYNQDKILIGEGRVHTSMGVFEEEEDLTALKLLGTMSEDEICVNSEDYIFSMVRNYMDASTVASAAGTPLGTLFADVNVNAIGDVVQKSGIQNGQFYIFSIYSSSYIYSDLADDYLNGNNPLEFCEYLLDDGSGYEQVEGQWVFYEKIEGIDAYAVLVLDDGELMGSFFQIRIVLIMVLCFACAFLLLFYMIFSVRISDPVRRLKEAMEQVEKGNLDVRVDLNTRDEMGYVAEGFNQMTERLKDYIKQVYVAWISRKDAELNALKMQIQPHYLYNTLDVIRMTALDQNDRKTAELLESLAHQLRYVIGNQSDRVYLREELDVIREYFMLMQVRYEDRISLTIYMADEDGDLAVPKLILQPVVENAIRHGLREKKGNGSVGIRVERKADYLEIVVMDDGVGMTEEQIGQIKKALENPEIGAAGQEEKISVGMKNVYDRIKLNCGLKYGFTVHSVRGMGTSVTFQLPIWEEL